MLAVDTYGTSEAARVLGVSPKRVRQLVAAGTLEAESRDPLRISQQAVHELREQRKADKRTKEPEAPAPLGDSLAPLVQLVTQMQERESERIGLLLELQQQLTRAQITAQAAESLQAERDALAARVSQLEQQLNARKGWRKRRAR